MSLAWAIEWARAPGALAGVIRTVIAPGAIILVIVSIRRRGLGTLQTTLKRAERALLWIQVWLAVPGGLRLLATTRHIPLPTLTGAVHLGATA